MKLFDHELASHKIAKALEDLTLEERRSVLRSLIDRHGNLKELPGDVKENLLTEMVKPGVEIVGTTDADTASLETALEEIQVLQGARSDHAILGHTHRVNELGAENVAIQGRLADIREEQAELERMTDEEVIERYEKIKVTNTCVDPGVLREAFLDRFVEPMPQPGDPGKSAGEVFASSINSLITLRMSADKTTRSMPERIALMHTWVNEECDRGGATDAERRFCLEMYSHTPALLLEGGLKYDADPRYYGELCMAWARACEVLPDARQRIEEAIKRIARSVWPPNIDSATNVEAMLMAVCYCSETIAAVDEDLAPLARELMGDVIKVLAQRSQSLVSFARRYLLVEDHRIGDGGFGAYWLKSSFAKLEIGHKLAASLCLTDVPDDIEVAAPWMAWSLVLPDKLFEPIEELSTKQDIYPSRLFCVGSTFKYMVFSNGRVLEFPQVDVAPAAADAIERMEQAASNLVKGCCLALSDLQEETDRQLELIEESTYVWGS